MTRATKIAIGLLAAALVLVLVVLVGVLAVSMGSGNESGSTSGSNQSTTSASSGGSAGGQFTLLGGDPPTLDPARAGDVESATYIVEIFSGLLTLSKELKVTPDIAKEWSISQDGKTYTFKLRDDAKFHDGKAVTAKDFKYSIERAADPKTESTSADTYLGDIIGVKDKLSGKAREVQGVKVVDDYTLQLEIDSPKSYFLSKLTYPTAFVLDGANVEGSRNWTDKPNGSGPFKLKEWKKGERIILERNANFYNGAPKLERVNYILSGGSPMAMYENGEIDITGVSIFDIDRVMDPKEPLNNQLRITPMMDIFYVGFNATVAPFDDVKVRQAFNHAVDKDKIIEVVLRNLYQRADGILPPEMPGYNPNVKGLKYDPTRAKELIAQSKYSDASKFPPIVMSIPGTFAATSTLTEAISQMWEQNLGVKVQLQQVEWATYLEDLKQHKYQLYSDIGWIADYPDPQNFLDLLFHSGSLENNSLYSNAQVDKVLEQARLETKDEARLKLYQQAEQMIVDDAPWIPLWFTKSYVLVKPYIKGYDVTPMIVPQLKDVYIEGK